MKSGTESGTKSGVKSKDEAYNSMERMMEIKSREKLGLKTNQSMVDIEDDDDVDHSELVDDFVDDNDLTEDPFVDQYATASKTQHERHNTDTTSNDSSFYEPSHMLL